jgi:hypothetical protein
MSCPAARGALVDAKEVCRGSRGKAELSESVAILGGRGGLGLLQGLGPGLLIQDQS